MFCAVSHRVWVFSGGGERGMERSSKYGQEGIFHTVTVVRKNCIFSRKGLFFVTKIRKNDKGLYIGKIKQYYGLINMNKETNDQYVTLSTI